MIHISDKILPHLLECSRKELMTYLLIKRYITEEENIPLDHIQRLTRQTQRQLGQTLAELRQRNIIRIEGSPLNQVILDLIDNSSGVVCLREKSRERTISIILKEYKRVIELEYNKEQTDNKKITSARGLSLEQEKITKKYRKTLTKLRNKALKGDANLIVDHLADAMIRLYEGLSLTPRWRQAQFSIAKRLLKEHKLQAQEWLEAIDYFAGQKYWKDKLSSLKQVENNIHQYYNRQKKKSSIAKKVTIIR